MNKFVNTNRFKAGDRAHWYHLDELVDKLTPIGPPMVITIEHIIGNALYFRDANGKQRFAHYRACRKLVKRKRREVWVRVRVRGNGQIGGYVYSSKEEAEINNTVGGEWKAVRFIEAKK